MARAERKRRSGSSGVTLLELTLVLALISLAVSIAIPSFVGYVDRANVSRAIGDIGSLSIEIARWQTNFGRLPDTLAEAGLDGRLDPWDRPYVYLNIANAVPGAVRRDKNLNPVNTDYDLYIVGKDGETMTAFTAQQARDDVVRANDGRFLGLAEDY
jgi:general secretion pathway protein G